MVPDAFPAALRGRFRLLRPLAGGPGSGVYLVEDREAGQTVALKTYPSLRFAPSEWPPLAQVDSPILARPLSWGALPGGGIFMTSEPALGPDLVEAGRAGIPPPVGWPEAILRPLAGALGRLHALGLLHNDVKPANIRWTPAGVRLCDLGPGARLRSGPPADSLEPWTLAPERLRGEPWDERADLYALGASIFRALADGPHAAGRRAAEVLRAMATPRSLADARRDLPAALTSAIDRLLAFAPTDRPASAGDLLAALDGNASMARRPPRAAARPAVPAEPTAQGLLESRLAELEEQLVREALRDCEDNQSRAATRLGISRRGLWLKMKRYRIPLRRAKTIDV